MCGSQVLIGRNTAILVLHWQQLRSPSGILLMACLIWKDPHSFIYHPNILISMSGGLVPLGHVVPLPLTWVLHHGLLT